MYEIDLRRVNFASGEARKDSAKRLSVAAISSIVPDRAFRSLALLHMFADRRIVKLPHISDGDLSTLASLDYLYLDDSKVEVTLR